MLTGLKKLFLVLSRRIGPMRLLVQLLCLYLPRGASICIQCRRTLRECMPFHRHPEPTDRVLARARKQASTNLVDRHLAKLQEIIGATGL